MSDVHQGDSAPAPAPAAHNIPDAIEGGSLQSQIERSVEAVNEQRAQRGEAVEVERSPTRIRYRHRNKDEEPKTYKDAEPKKLRRVAADTSDFHRTQDPEFQQSVPIGADPAKLLAMAKDPEEVRRLTGWTAAEAKEYARTGAMPPQKIGVVKTDGYGNRELREPLGDHGSPDEALTPRQAAKEQDNFRQELAAQQQALRNEIDGAEARIEAQREQERIEAEGRAEQERIAHEQAESQRQQALQQRQADDAERIRVAQLEWERGATNEERTLHDNWNKWVEWAKTIPEMVSVEAAQHTIRTNPQRTAQLQQAKAKLDAAQAAIQRRLTELGHTRQLQQYAVATHQTQAQQQAYRQYSEQEDIKANEMISREIPHWKTEEGRAAISKASRAMLKNLGLTDQHIEQVWDNGAPINLRSAPAQAIMAKAAAYDLAVARAREAQKAGVPPVQRPGVARPRGAGAAENVRALQAQLANAKGGNQSLKIAAQLTRAKRAAGML
jgi:hypothetical protein